MNAPLDYSGGQEGNIQRATLQTSGGQDCLFLSATVFSYGGYGVRDLGTPR
jgi:hypothetical protein